MALAVKLVWVALAGAAGTLARYGIAEGVKFLNGGPSPIATMKANFLGCFLFGLIWSMCEHRSWPSPETRLILLAGFMGAFTTFSTFIFESSDFLRQGAYGMALLNLFGQTAGGFLCMFLGLSLGRGEAAV